MRDGVINILKPPGLTSNDVVYDVRRALSIKRVGHTGTLDPGACGVLPVCIGRATKLFDYLMEKEKEYIAHVCFGIETDTLDSYGTVTNVDSNVHICAEDIESVIPEFLGDIKQTAPMYSAVSVNGQRLYKLARRGIEVERKQRDAHIYAIEIMRKCAEKEFMLKIRCSKGTYIRTLCNDIAHRLNTYAYVSFLLRSASGRFNLKDSVTIEELISARDESKEDELILPVFDALDFLPTLSFNCDEQIYKKLLNGASVVCEGNGKGQVRVVYGEKFIGIGEYSGDTVRIKTRFCED